MLTKKVNTENILKTEIIINKEEKIEKSNLNKAVSEKEIFAKISSSNLNLNLINSTKNSTKKAINFVPEVKKTIQKNDVSKKPPNQIPIEDKQINFKVLNEKVPEKNAKIVAKDSKSDLKIENKIEPKIPTKTKDIKIPLTTINLTKAKVELKYPNSSRPNENKIIFETNIITNNKKDFSSTSSGFKIKK